MTQFSLTPLLAYPGLLAAVLLLSPTAAHSKSVSIADTAAKSVKETSLPESAQVEVQPILAQVPSVSELATPKPQTQSQVTSVSQLSDVQPTDWAFQALQSLVERYGCIAGYPDGTYRGNRALTRYEFAAGLNACLDQVLALVGGDGGIDPESLATIRRLQEEFAAELATLRGRVDALEARTAELEANQFSTTTKLQGEVAFVLADSFLSNGTPDGDDDSQTIFADRVRLQLISSFSGKDKLYTRLTAGNLDNSFADEIGTNEGRFAFDGEAGNDITIDRLHYVFPVGEKLKVTAMASGGGHHFYADTLNPGLEAGGGASGALSRFAERNPIYRVGLGGQGIGFSYALGDAIDLYAGYLARGGFDPSQKSGLFNGNNSLLGQITFEPTEKFRLGLTYVHGYDRSGPAARRFLLGGTGTALGVLNPGALDVASDLDVTQLTTPVVSNSYGVEALFSLSPKFRVGGWFGYTDARLIGLGDAEIWNYALTLAFPDLGKPGSLAAIIVGAEPYLGGIDIPGEENFNNDVPIHVEAFYKVPVTSNISITPGAIWLLSPNQNEDNDDVVIGTVRTTFSF
jgi:Carbohydrate-selective porin, OprB family/S-layer homology domain